MDKRPLIGVSICAVILLILASLSNVVGYQTVQSSAIKTEIRQLSNSNCDCESNTRASSWSFPVICLIAEYLVLIGLFLALTLGWGNILIGMGGVLIETFHCWECEKTQ